MLPMLLSSVPFPDVVPLRGCGQPWEAAQVPTSTCSPLLGARSSCWQFLLPPPGSSSVHFNTFANLLWHLCFPLSFCSSALHLHLLRMALMGMLHAISVLFSASSTWPQPWDPPCQACSPPLLTQPVPLMPKSPWPHHTCPIFLCTTSQSLTDEL